jgi:hypothetical protein
MAAEQPVALRVGSREVPLGVNRRRIVDGRVVMAPNPEGPVDPGLTVVSFDEADGRPLGLLVNYGVHPTTLGVNLFCVSADYPGRLDAVLRAEIGPEVEYAFLQGACGDVKPAIYDGEGEFREGTEADIDRLGRDLGDSVLRILDSAEPATGGDIEVAAEPFFFRYGPLPTDEALAAEEQACERLLRSRAPGPPDRHLDPRAAAEYMAGWARRMRARLAAGGFPPGVTAPLGFFRIGREVAFVGVPGELFSETGLAIKNASPFAATLVTGYTGPSLGYFATAAALREGGYEASDAFKYYGHPAAFAPETAEELVAVCGSVLSRWAPGLAPT